MKQFTNKSEEILSLLSTLAAERRTGEILLQGNNEESAKVYLHNGLIVWAFATGQRESFQSILLKENKLSKDQLLEGIKESRRSGKKNLEDILFLLGISNPDERRKIVERHTRAALEVILNLGQCAVQFNAHQVGPEENVKGLPLERLLHGFADAAPEREPKARRASDAERSYKADLASSAVADIPEILERLRFEIPSFLAAMIVEGRTSMPIAALSDAPGLDLEVVSAFYRDLLQSAQQAQKAIGTSTTSPLEEVLISSKNDYVLLRSLCEGSHFLYLLIDQDSNPGMAKVVIRRYLDQLHSFLS